MGTTPSIATDPVAYWEDSVRFWEGELAWSREHHLPVGVAEIALEHARAALEAVRLRRIALAGAEGEGAAYDQAGVSRPP